MRRAEARLAMGLALALASAGGAALAVERTGWRTDFAKHIVPLEEIQGGGPGKDGIPPIDRPVLLPAERVDFLQAREPVIGLVVNGVARAYPLQILIWHEIVNDEIGGVPVAVTFCPLCHAAIAFDRRLEGATLSFGTTGNLRNSDLVMYDRQTESWWQQFGGEGIVGRHAGKRLVQLPSRIFSWQDFRGQHPQGTVLSRDTGFSRPYGRNPYPGYDDAATGPIFPVARGDGRLPAKERVVFVERGGEAVAIPFSILKKRSPLPVTVSGHKLEVRLRGSAASSVDTREIAAGREVASAEVRESGELVPFQEPFWFAVAAFRPRVMLATTEAR